MNIYDTQKIEDATSIHTCIIDIVFKQYFSKVFIKKMISGNEMSDFVLSARDDYYHDVLFVLMIAISIKGIVSFFERRLFCLLKSIQ
jgi:hypothetical protein